MPENRQNNYRQNNLGIDLTGADVPSLSLFEPFLKGSYCFSGIRFFFFSSSPLPKEVPHMVIEKEHLIEMKDDPKSFLKKSKSSLSIAFAMMKTGELQAVYSAANTAALVAFSKKILGFKKGIKWPALIVEFPSKKESVLLLDAGASSISSASHLNHLAELGAYYWKILYKTTPRVGLLNVGKESVKGPLDRRQAYRILMQKRKEFTFIGNIESKQIFSGDVDVALTDGFSGNIFLKTAEATAEFIMSEAPSLDRLPASCKAVQKMAILGGLNGLVFKSHGGISPIDFYECAKTIAKKMSFFNFSAFEGVKNQKV